MAFESAYFLDRGIRNVMHVGADRGGEITQYLALGVERVIWVEANPEQYAEMQVNLRMLDPDARIKNVCLNRLISDTDDAVSDFHLYYGPDAGYLVGNKGASSILPITPNTSGESWYRGTMKMRTVTLDTMCERENLGYEFDMLNMDTQGTELLVCKGATKILNSVRYINTEITLFNPAYQGNVLFDELAGYLATFGFKHVQTFLAAERNWGDAIFVKQ
jgi:FkbM family methyltransferase